MEELGLRYKLSDFAEMKYGKDHKKLDHGDIPVYGTGGIMRLADRYLYNGDSVLIPRKGSLNNIQFVSGKFWTVDTTFWTIVDESIVRAKYFYYLMKQIDFTTLNVGSAVPSMTTAILNGLEVEVPNLETQDRILHTLFPIEQKVLTLSRINDNFS